MSPSGKAKDFDSFIRGFESRHPSFFNSNRYDSVAQLAEQHPFKVTVRGSNPRWVIHRRGLVPRRFSFAHTERQTIFIAILSILPQFIPQNPPELRCSALRLCFERSCPWDNGRIRERRKRKGRFEKRIANPRQKRYDFLRERNCKGATQPGSPKAAWGSLKYILPTLEHGGTFSVTPPESAPSPRIPQQTANRPFC